MDVLREAAQVRAATRQWRASGARIAFVPTMGYLHEGHLALVRRARQLAEHTVVSIFVNPTQFGPGEDFERYPRDEARDLALLEREGVDVVYLPDAGSSYPAGYETWVVLERLPGHLCGLSRPGHFRGVATVCTKLFHAVEPDVAVFGEKDYQQLAIIRRMVRDLDFPIDIVGHPIVREPDGLAMSSRNAYLSADERKRATALYAALCEARDAVAQGAVDAAQLCRAMADRIAASGGRVDYASIVDPDTLDDLQHIDRPARALVAAWYGTTRLIDNIALQPPNI